MDSLHHSKLAKHCKASGRNTARKPAWKYGTKRLEGQSDPKLSWPRCTSYDRNDTIHLISDLICAYIILHLTSTKWLSHICTARQQRSLRVSRGKTEQVSLKTQDDPSRDSLKQVKRTVETLDASGIVPSAGPGPLDSLLALLLQPRRTLWLWWTLLDIFSGDPGILTISWWWITIRNGTPLLINQGASMNLGST